MLLNDLINGEYYTAEQRRQFLFSSGKIMVFTTDSGKHVH